MLALIRLPYNHQYIMSERITEDNSFAMLLNRSGLTQSCLAKKINVRQATISSWVNGHSVPTLTPLQLRRLLEALDCTLDELIEACHIETRGTKGCKQMDD